jgi:predicted transcriptional regulator
LESKQGSGTVRPLLNYRSFSEGIGVVEILQCLKKYGQRLDLEIAKEMGIPLATVRQRLAGLAATGQVVTCSLTRYEGGKRIDAWQCRVSGYVPPVAPGRKAKRTT